MSLPGFFGRTSERGRGLNQQRGNARQRFAFANGAGRGGARNDSAISSSRNQLSYGGGPRGRGGRNSAQQRNRQNAFNPSAEVHPFGLLKLTEFLEKPNDDVISSIDRAGKAFKVNLSQADGNKADVMTILVRLIGEKICGETALPELQNRLVAMAADDEFLRSIQTFTFSLTYTSVTARRADGTVGAGPLEILKAACNFYAFIVSRMPSTAAEKLLPLLEVCSTVLEVSVARQKISVEESIDLLQRVNKLKTDVMELKDAREAAATKSDDKNKHFRKHQLSDAERERIYQLRPDEDFTKMSIIPSTDEIRAEEAPFLRPNLIHGSYPSVTTYLDVQFRLLREDFLAPLRGAVREYLNHEAEYRSRKKKPPPGTIRFYYNVRLLEVTCFTEITVFSMKFSMTNLGRVKWDKSKRLLNGSLILLTPDNFTTIYFATVARRDDRELSRGIVGIVWEGQRPPSYAGVTFLMVECEVYFESYRHTLKALQFMAKPGPPDYVHPRLRTFRMAKYIVDVSTEEIPPPTYISNLEEPMDFSLLLKVNQDRISRLVSKDVDTVDGDDSGPSCDSNKTLPNQTYAGSNWNLNMETLVPWKANVLNAAAWPDASTLGMDIPQYEAFRSAITQDLSIIQGPPGTGKTYIGLQIMKLLLSNRDLLWQQGGAPKTEESDFVGNVEPPSRSNFLPMQQDVERDPILIVCYTNHALDQFLEGILAIMETIGINPGTNLVRVGGRSKVEAIAQYGIHHLKQHYLKYRRFPEGYARDRNAARASLQGLQLGRADLKSLFKDLSQSTGLVMFDSLFYTLNSIQHELQIVEGAEALKKEILSSVSAALWQKFVPSKSNLVHWLGLNYSFFNKEDFNAESELRQIFRISRAPVPLMEVPAGEDGEDEDDDVDDDGEVKALLTAHRLEEEINMEDTSKSRKAVTAPLYRPYKPHEFNDRRKELNEKYEEAEQVGIREQMKQLLRIAWALDLEKQRRQNQATYLQHLFSAYSAGQMQLPEVTPELLARGHESEMPLLPSLSEKWAIYFYVVGIVKKFLMRNILLIEEEIMTAQERFEEIKNRGDGIILKKAMVVGLTTTGAAKYNTLVRMMKSRIVIVEEAAEVLESHIVTSLTEHCQQLILIGDHKQLRPPTTVYELAKDYDLDVSLFERLIRNQLSWNHLRAQHRMRPEICKLLVPTIYNDLVNDSSVYNYPNVRGLDKNLFFVTHNELEKAEADSMTKSNEWEATYAVQLCRYLLLQGYLPTEITILTTYIGQMFLIQNRMRAEGEVTRGVRVTVVDNFQGEENEIIILSLVRSNAENRIGFLRTENRICVALSRAKQGMYVIGNMDCMVGSKSSTWANIKDELEQQSSVGKALQLRCQNHGDLIPIERPEDFREQAPEGGCLKSCPGVLPHCNHACAKICHILDRNHVEYRCKFTCQRTCPDPAGHSCPHPCWKIPCPPCEVPMMRSLPCGHDVELPCWTDILTWSCVVTVSRALPCGHIKDLLCHLRVESYVCKVRVDKRLGCGHIKVLPCHQPVTDYECVELVKKELPCGHPHMLECRTEVTKVTCNARTEKELPCGHVQETNCDVQPANVRCLTILQKIKSDCKHEVDVQCFQEKEFEKWKCLVKCDTRLDCGHQCVRTCHLSDDPEHARYKCRKQCAKSCPDGHPCKVDHRCYQRCDPCEIRIERTLPCGHRLNLKCSDDPSRVRCYQPCERSVTDCPEGHLCLKKCYESCSPCMTVVEKISEECTHRMNLPCCESAKRAICEEMVQAKLESPCGHVVEVPCRIQDKCEKEELLRWCHHPCGHIVPTDEGGCGHPCQGDCSACYQGRVHAKCQEKCGRVLTCGHVCKYPCSSLCPPCEEKCILRCQHSSCKKKCGVPCNDCKEFCKWACEHKRCRKRCGEVCNREPCDEPCRKKIKKCGHECIGSCGEPCPTLCRTCDKEMVEEILFGPEEDEDARFVLLEDCGHAIHRESMDTWMRDSRRSGDGSANRVAICRCPRCNTIMTKSVRYGSALKEGLQSVLKVREKIFGNDAVQRAQQEEMANQLMLSSSDVALPLVRDWLSNMIYEVRRFSSKKSTFRTERELKKMDQYTFESLSNVFNWWDEAEDNLRMKPLAVDVPPVVTPQYNRDIYGQQILIRTPVVQVRDEGAVTATTYQNKLRAAYENVFSILLDRAQRLPLTNQELDDFEGEFERCHDLHRLYRRRSVKNFTTVNGALFMFTEAEKLLAEPKAYDDRLQEGLESKLKTLDELLKTAAKDPDRRARVTFQAMGFSSQHWYTCQNGHFYVVADCSNFNAAGHCPDCRAPVGSGSSNTRVGDERNILLRLGAHLEVTPPADFGSDRSRRGGRGRGRGGREWRRGRGRR